MTPPTGRLRRGIDWCFRNRRTGQITIGQFPNLSVSLAAAFYLLAAGLRFGGVADWPAIWAGRVCLTWWAGDEVLRGVNPWRRILGGGVLVYLCVTLFRLA